MAETFVYTVRVTADTDEQADQVMAERLGYDEDYGFDYEIVYTVPDLDLAEEIDRSMANA